MKKKVSILFSILTMFCLFAIPSFAECTEIDEYEVCPVLRDMYGAESPEFLYGYSLKEDKVHNFSITITDNDANIVPIFIHHEEGGDQDPTMSPEPTESVEPTTSPEPTTPPEPEVEQLYFVDCKTDWRNQVCSVIADIYGRESVEFTQGYTNLPDETHVFKRYISLINDDVYLVPSENTEDNKEQGELVTPPPVVNPENEDKTEEIVKDYNSIVGTTLDVKFFGTDMTLTLILDNKNVKCEDSGIELFKTNNFNAFIQGTNLVVSKSYSITKVNDELKNDFELVKQALLEINPALRDRVNPVTMEAKVSNSGFPMVGVTIASFKFENMPDFKVIGSGDKLVYVSELKIPVGEEVQFDGRDSFEFEVFNNTNVDNVAISTTVSKDRISSNMVVTFKENVKAEIDADDIQDPRVSSFNLSSKSLNITYDYTTPDMFNSMHSHDIYNLFGGLYFIQLQDNGLYFKRGELEIKSISNDGVSKVKYDVYYKDNLKGSADIEDGQTYNLPYTQVETGNLVITLIVVLSIGFVIFGFIKLSKRK